METQTNLNQKISFTKEVKNYHPEILTDGALIFLEALQNRFNERRLVLLKNRQSQQQLFDLGTHPSFPENTKEIRNSEWAVAPIPMDLQDRRVEITGPVDRKMVINALNSGAKTFMADFEDSNAPLWENCLQGQKNLKDAVNKTISFYNPKKDKTYRLNEKTATLIVRPRGLHLNEKHLLSKGEEVSASLFDFALYLFHNNEQLKENGTGPYYYIPKLEHFTEAIWWNDVIDFSENYLGIKHGTVKVTVLVETITASFQLDEIIYALKDHIVGLNCGRWDYIFSYIKKLRNHPGFVVPDRAQVTMTSPFMDAYSKLVIQRCHKRNILAIGGMAAQIPIKDDEDRNAIAYAKVQADKEREVKNGHDGTWVAHPGLVALAMRVFDTHMPNPNQMDVKRDDINITENDLLAIPKGTITEKGIRQNINVGIHYIATWLGGNGAVALYHLMEDAATAEISRTQIWQWLQHEVVLEDGRTLNNSLFTTLFKDELEVIKKQVGNVLFETENYQNAIQIFEKLVTSDEFEEFLTTRAYQYI
ncbi:malate synthase [Aquimarina sp. EL_43]|uniref:malate synthase A n=1 Tax=unclassified Aquimarina TaxID=2627091 RepID=UPI0018CB06E2|nr:MULTISPECIES: malate synthase A [unclassified Aquimarina]MBG6130403.1 malate synthase [Aquimarina sp. EL_35]MBG6149183.1 malate synthase [Aquimarina sp. EL_32]MBG6168443.1 malate synthase [Aquimarina sp. EL_43]